MSTSKSPSHIRSKDSKLIFIEGCGFYVPVNHEWLGNLVGSLMQVCDLTGDKEQREALKREIKGRTRQWLNDLYEQCGYDPMTHDLMTGDKKPDVTEIK